MNENDEKWDLWDETFGFVLLRGVLVNAGFVIYG